MTAYRQRTTCLAPDALGILTKEHTRHETKAIVGSQKLRDAIFRMQGIAPPRRAVAVEIFRPRKIKVATKRGRPRGAFKVREIDPRIMRVQTIIADHFGITVGDLVGGRRIRKHSHPRQIAVYAARHRFGIPYLDLAFNFGGRDHTTLIYAVREVETRIEDEDQKTITALMAIRAELGA